MDVVVDTATGAHNPTVRQAVGQAETRHEHVLLRLVEVVRGADLGRDEFGRAVESVAPFEAAPQALHVLRGRVVFPAEADVDGQFAAGFPVVLDIEAHAILADIGEGESFRRIGAGGGAQQEGRVAVVGKGVGEGERAARIVRCAAVQRHAAELAAELHGMGGESPVHVVADDVHSVVVETIAAVGFGEALEALNAHRRDTGFARRELAVAVVDDSEGIHAQGAEVEVGVRAGIEAVVARLRPTIAEFVDEGRREDVEPLAGIIVVAAFDPVGELRRSAGQSEQSRDVGGVAEEDLVFVRKVVIDADEVLIVVDGLAADAEVVEPGERIGEVDLRLFPEAVQRLGGRRDAPGGNDVSGEGLGAVERIRDGDRAGESQ